MATFKTRARALDMLGRQQIAGIPTAISELFKNAHDAYADHADIDFYREDNLFILRDDGIGMTREEFESRWLTIGTESKLVNKNSSKPYQPLNKEERPMMGEKGIGRLSIAVIGPQVLVLTKAIRGKEKYSLVAAFLHWGIFECPGINLEDINIPIREFPLGTLPAENDISEMVEEFKSNLETIKENADKNYLLELKKDLSNFKLDPQEVDGFLGGSETLSLLNEENSGTHFYILPASELLAEDIDGVNPEKATPLEKALLGFTNSITNTEPPRINVAFRDFHSDLLCNDVIDKENFFTESELQNVDHRIVGEFDRYGQFTGSVSIYGETIENYQLPWKGSKGEETDCGPFIFEVSIVQGMNRQSTIPFEEHAKITAKLDRMGGLYIYRDGIRILPYGDTDFDWLDIEFNRTKGASYHYYSFRRMLGVIDLNFKDNFALKEKAGREGFRENKAYRQMKSILKNFFSVTAGDFFREEGSKSSLFLDKRSEMERLDKLRKKREKTISKRKKDFLTSLGTFHKDFEEKSIESQILELTEKLSNELEVVNTITDPIKKSEKVVELENRSLSSLNEIVEKYKISKPKIGLSIKASKDWEDYQVRFLELEQNVINTAKEFIDQEIVLWAKEAKLTLDRRMRLQNSINSIKKKNKSLLNKEGKSTKGESEKVAQDVKKVVNESISSFEDLIAEIEVEFNKKDFDSLSEKEVVEYRTNLENKILQASEERETKLKNIQEQLESISLDGDGGQLDQMEAIEQQLILLDEKAETDLQLTQLGMAIEIINHEFEHTVKAIRNRLRELHAWADLNEDLKDLYDKLRGSFDHLDSYLTLFTPLHRRLHRKQVEITGDEILKYVTDLFEEKLKRHSVEIEATSKFKKNKIIGYPSSFYPVFVNLVDNSVFWLKDLSTEKKVIFDLDGESMIISDTGKGIQDRDREAVFELGFTRKPGGRGMGLHISRESLKKENYSLELEPYKEGQGATFKITPIKISEEE